MDITKLEQEETHFDEPVEVTLYDDAGEPELDSTGQPVVVWVVGEYAKEVRKQVRINTARFTKLLRRYGAMEAIPQNESDEMYADKLAAHFVKWQGFEANGAPFPFSRANAVAVIGGLQKYRPKQIAQIEGAIAAHASFFTKPSSGSAST